jgi:hypothetical protein
MRWMALLILVVAGCSESGIDTVELEKRVGAPIYWLGEEFEGLPLTHAEGSTHGAFFMYGDCDPEGDGCAPPLEVQNVKCQSEPTAVVIFAGTLSLRERAARALKPVGRPAARPPLVAIGRNPFCSPH